MNTDDFDDLFNNSSEPMEETEAQESEAETEVEPVEETAEEAVETEAEAPEAEVEVETKPEAPAQPAEDRNSANFVPLAALLDEREKAKSSKSEIDRLQKQIADLQAAQAPSEVPDPLYDPEGYQAYFQNSVSQEVARQVAAQQEAALAAQFAQARTKAVEEHGESFVTDLADWADHYAMSVDPNIGEKALKSPDPVKYLIDLRERRQSIEQFEADPQGFIQRRAIEMGLVPKAETISAVVDQTNQSTSKKTSPRSIAAAASRGTDMRITQEDAFDDIFKK